MEFRSGAERQEKYRNNIKNNSGMQVIKFRKVRQKDMLIVQRVLGDISLAYDPFLE